MPDMLFPIIQPNLTQSNAPLPLYREVAWDFVKGKPIFKDGNPVIVTGKEAVVVWAYKALLTQRGRYEIYTWNFGSDVETLIGQQYSIYTKKAEAIRYVRECLLINPYITDVRDINTNFERGVLHISATIITIYGEAWVNV